MADIAIFRINYKSDFILTLNSDAGWETPFCIKFWTGAPSQAYFVGYDGTTYTHCAPVEGDPTKLTVQFDDHHLPIGDLKFQIGYHFTVADFPTTVEDEVLNQASVIIEQDGEHAQVMLDLTGETAPEMEFSLPAYANEAQRIANEQQRIENEQARISAENERISNEDARIAEEQVRVSQEEARVSEFAQLKEESQEATANANAASQLATEKAALAQQKANYAETQGNYAKAQGDYAKAQGDTALADHERAETDHSKAASDHTQAAEDHSRAESDHTRAESDHASIEVYVDSLGAFDVSAYHATGGVLAKYANLTAALGTDGANIPEVLRKGGMSVKFVLSSDNKYVQARLMADAFTTDVTKWQSVDEEPINNSKNMVESGGVAEVLGDYSRIKTNDSSIFTVQNTIIRISDGESAEYANWLATNYIRFDANESVRYKGNVNSSGSGICFYDENKDYIANSGVLAATTEKTLEAPTNAVYFRACGFAGAYVAYSIPNYGINGKIGNLQELKTEDKSTIVNAINDVVRELGQEGEQKTQDASIFSIQNTIINKNTGESSYFADWLATPYIEIDPSKTIKYKGGVNATNAGIFFYDANKNPISNSGSSSRIYEIIITPPTSAAYFRASGFASAYVTYSTPATGVKGEIGDLQSLVTTEKTCIVKAINELANELTNEEADIEAINQELGQAGDKKYQDTSVFTLQNTVIHVADGEDAYFDGWIATDYITFDMSKSFRFKGNVNSSGSGICFYDGNKNFISDSGTIARIEELNITPPANAVYFRASGHSGAYVTYSEPNYGINGDIKELQDKFLYLHDSVTEDIVTMCNDVRPTIDNLTTAHSKDFTEIGTKYAHHSYFKAPNGESKCKLVISFPGGGATAHSWYSYMNHGAVLNSLGYAVLCITGWSVDWCHDKISQSTDAVMPVGNWMALEEATKAYQYVINKYDWIDRDGVYLYGESQGGCLAENFAEMAGIPVLSTVLDSPVVSLKYHMWKYRQPAINAFYGIGDTEWEADKVIGCDPYTRNMSEEITGTGVNPSSVVDFANITARKFRACKSPIMIMLCNNDATISPSVTKGYVKALRNAGNMCEFKLYDLSNASGNHGVVQYTDVVGTINGISTTAGLEQVLEFFKRGGGYSYSLVTN